MKPTYDSNWYWERQLRNTFRQLADAMPTLEEWYQLPFTRSRILTDISEWAVPLLKQGTAHGRK